MKRSGDWSHRIAALLLLVALASGCSLIDAADREIHGRFGRSGQAVQPYLVPAPDASVQALYDSFDLAVKESLKAGE